MKKKIEEIKEVAITSTSATVGVMASSEIVVVENEDSLESIVEVDDMGCVYGPAPDFYEEYMNFGDRITNGMEECVVEVDDMECVYGPAPDYYMDYMNSDEWITDGMEERFDSILE